MVANFTRRRDLFLDAGFAHPDELLAQIARETAALPQDWKGAGRGALKARVARLAPDQLRLALLVPEWILMRSGDLATALWIAREEHRAALDVPGFLLAVVDSLLDAHEPDAVAFARFMLDARFDWQRVYEDPSLAFEFLKERDPNPLAWRLLDELDRRGNSGLSVLELGCGVGNDAFAFLRSPRVSAYTGIDVSQEALAAFRKRAERESPRTLPSFLQADFFEALQHPPKGVNLVYSYSSLHYFSSAELARIYELIRRAAPDGFFAFGIKGKGSVWEGQGLPLYRPDVWVNRDGQSRWFPSREALASQLDRAGFEIRFHEMHEHWGYSELGKKDVFHFVLCSPRKE